MTLLAPPQQPACVSPSDDPRNNSWMRQPYCILSVVGDVLDHNELYFVEAAQTLDAAKARVQSLAEMCPGQYVIYDEETGERVAITSGGQSH